MKLNPLLIEQSDWNIGGLSFHHDKCPLKDKRYQDLTGMYVLWSQLSDPDAPKHDQALGMWQIQLDNDNNATEYTANISMSVLKDKNDPKNIFYETYIELSTQEIRLGDKTILYNNCLLQGNTGKWTSYNIRTDLLTGGLAKFGINDISQVGIEAWRAYNQGICARLNIWSDGSTAHCEILHTTDGGEKWKTIATIC